MNSQEIRQALESIHDPLVYNQAWVDCSNLLNLSKETLEAHFQQWLWHELAIPEYDPGEFSYYLELAKIEEYLVEQGVIYS